MTGQTNTVWKRKGERVSICSSVFFIQKTFLLNEGQSLISTGLVVSFFYERTKSKTPEKKEKIRNEKKDINLLTVRVMMGINVLFFLLSV